MARHLATETILRLPGQTNKDDNIEVQISTMKVYPKAKPVCAEGSSQAVATPRSTQGEGRKGEGERGRNREQATAKIATNQHQADFYNLTPHKFPIPTKERGERERRREGAGKGKQEEKGRKERGEKGGGGERTQSIMRAEAQVRQPMQRARQSTSSIHRPP